MHLIAHSFVLWFTDKLIDGGLFTFYHIYEIFELKIRTPRIENKKKNNHF